jgi:hypothetical protein
MNTCKLCGATSDEKQFYCGVTSRCAECHRAKVRENRAANVEYYRAYDAERFQADPKVKERHRRYQATEAGKRSMEQARLKWMANSPEKRAAHVILGNAVRDGLVSKPKCCSRCGAGGKIHGHHFDYTKPLDVIWLCPACHHQEHADNDNAVAAKEAS